MKRMTASVFVAFLAVAMWAQGPTQFHPGFNLFSKQQDVQLGQENAAQVRKQLPVIKDPVLTDYVTRVGKRLMSAREAQESGFPFTFEVVADPSINAFALPGGPMFINTGRRLPEIVYNTSFIRTKPWPDVKLVTRPPATAKPSQTVAAECSLSGSKKSRVSPHRFL